MFVSLLCPGYEVPVTILRRDDEFIVQVQIGYDDATERVYSLFVGLSPLIGCADIPGYELVFAILDASLNGTEVIDHHDGAATRKFLGDPDDRTHVRSVLIHATELLIDEAQPNQIQMLGAEERHKARFAAWMQVREIRELVCRPAPGQNSAPHYERSQRRIICCG